MLGPGAVHIDLDRHVAQHLSKARGVEAVYCYDHAALKTFAVARERGIRCFYDLPIGYWRAFRALADEESHIHPEWAPLDPFGGLPEEMFLRKDAEIAAADTIIVASSFTRKTLALAPVIKAPIHVIPYGAPAVPDQPVFHEKSERLRVLFVGSLGIRKGLPYLLEAIGRLGRAVELTLIGRPDGACPPLDAALKTHRWIASLPHREILREMDRHDVLVFPSLFEGFGLVILEALSRGMPVITTANTAGPDILEEGKDGFIIPIRSSDAIAEKLFLLHQDRELLKDMSANAIAKAKRCEWRHFGAATVDLVAKSLEAGARNVV